MTKIMTTCGHCGLPIHPAESGVRYFGHYRAHSESRCRELLRTHLRALVEAVEQALPILEEAIDSDIISCSRIHHPGATVLEHLASMDADDRAATTLAITARDSCKQALDALGEASNG